MPSSVFAGRIIRFATKSNAEHPVYSNGNATSPLGLLTIFTVNQFRLGLLPTRRGGWSDVTRQLAAEAGVTLLANSPRRLE